jgi:hypothetical protein
MGFPITPLPGELARTQTAPSAAPVPDISPMLAAVQHIQNSFGVSPEASAVLTRALYAPVIHHPEMQRWLAIAYPQPQTPAPKNPQEAAARLAQMALLFGQRS